MQRFRLFWDYRRAFLTSLSGYHHDSSLALILGSCYPCLYYGFYCEPHYRIGYLLLITLAGLGAWTSLYLAQLHNYFFLAAAYIVLNPEFTKPTHRHARTRIFIALGLCSILPVSHLLLSHGVYLLFREMGFLWLLAAGVMYIVGALL
jgi:adiponectin receptor